MRTIGLLLMLAAAPEAFAEAHSGVILKFEGWRGSHARRAVSRSLGGVMEVVPQERYFRLARELGVDPKRGTGVAELCEQLELSVIVKGEVEGRGARARTRIVVQGPEGEILGEKVSDAPIGRHGLRRIGLAARDAVAAALGQVDEVYGELPEGDADAAPKAEPASFKAALVPKDELPKASVKKSGLVPKDEVEDEVYSVPGEDRPAPIAPPTERADPVVVVPKRAPSEVGAALRLELGAGARSRSARIELSTSETAAHDSGLFPELRLLAEARPFTGAFSRGFLAEADLALGVGLASLGPDGSRVGTSAFRTLVQVGYALELGAFELGARFGFGLDDFSFEDNTIIGSTTYTFLRGGAELRLALAGEYLQAALHGGVRPVLSTGEVGLRYYQKTAAIGYDVGLRLFGALDGGFSYGVRAGWELYGLGFQDDLAPARMAPLDTLIGASTGTDTSLHFGAELGWRFDG